MLLHINWYIKVLYILCQLSQPVNWHVLHINRLKGKPFHVIDFFPETDMEMLYKKGVLKNLTNFTGKRLCWSLFFHKKETRTQVFSCGFCQFFKNTFFTEHLRAKASENLWFSADFREYREISGMKLPNEQYSHHINRLRTLAYKYVVAYCYKTIFKTI